MSGENYLRQPKSMVETTLKRKTDENPHLRNALDRTSSHPLITKK